MRSSYAILFYEGPQSYVVSAYNENIELNKQLWQYHSDIGAEAYETDDNDPIKNVKWKLQEKWYSTSQIERIMKLRAFL